MALTVKLPARWSRKLHGKDDGPFAFLRDIGMLLAGSGGAQLVTLLSAPLLGRIYTPVDFAALAVLTSTFQIVSRFSSLKYETAIATGTSKPQMGALAALALGALLATAGLCALASLLFLPLLAAKLGMGTAIVFCFVLPVIVLFDGLIQIVITWSVRWKEFGVVSANDLIRNSSSIATQAGLGLGRAGGIGLLFGQAVGTIIAFVVLMRRPSTRELVNLLRRRSWNRRAATARRFIDFPKYQMPKAILNSLGRNLPTILIATYFSAATTGLFFFAQRLTTLPAQMISQSLGRVLLQRFAQRWTQQRKPITALLVKSTAFFLIPSVTLVLALFLFGDRFFVFFLGHQWAGAGAIATWTVVWSAATIIGTPAQMAMTVMRQNRIMLILEAIFLPMRLVPFPFFAASGDFLSAVATCCLAAALYNSVMIGTALVRARQLACVQRGSSSVPERTVS